MLQQLIDLIRKWITEKRTGKIIINFFKGGISSVDKHETVKLGQDTK